MTFATRTRGFAVVALGVLFRSRASSVRTWTRYRVGYADLDLGLRLSRQTMFTSIGKLFGGRDAEIGDQAFDRTFRVETDLPSKAKPFFTATRRGCCAYWLPIPVLRCSTPRWSWSETAGNATR